MADFEHGNSGFFNEVSCDLNDLISLRDNPVDPSFFPKAKSVEKTIPIYDISDLGADLADTARRNSLMSEWAGVLLKGPGVLVLKRAYPDTTVLDDATSIYETIIQNEKSGEGGGADHFAAAGSNDRVWNSLQKLCEYAPETFLRYFANMSISTACEAWLGPNYQMTAQVNLVHPGGQAQSAHRDYHLGFQTAELCATYPAHVHDLSPVLTLQGAVAHCDMPVESGPTKLLPYSHLYRPGYLAWRRQDFRNYFEENYVQLALEKGDALFFNPALFHAAGANTTQDIHRMANLLQVSSAFGRATESVDRAKMCKAVYPFAKAAKENGSMSMLDLNASIAATAEGYSFPTNLDKDPPVGGLAPETQSQLFKRALTESMEPDEFASLLDQIGSKQCP